LLKLMFSAFLLLILLLLLLILLCIRATPGLMNAEHRSAPALRILSGQAGGLDAEKSPPAHWECGAQAHPGYARTERNTEYMG
jgi:hypothetical protein